ncbi:MAG: pyridoxamine 5'-phosphate oxidase family protein [Rhodobacteraceae bacterium]|nr:pyridoxamine 5'-phosphate oxidase family protein [Paracoccaceae bacterium]
MVDPHRIEDHSGLEALYDAPATASLEKVTASMTPEYRAWITAARFCILSSVGPDGTDASPRGDDGPVVDVLDERTLALPDWRGNNRIDSLRNIVRDGRVSLMFMVPGSNNVIRVNGKAHVTTDPALAERFTDKGRVPRCVVVIAIEEVYFQCARALMRSGLWSGKDDSSGLPSMGDILQSASKGTIDGKRYDVDWPIRARKTMW